MSSLDLDELAGDGPTAPSKTDIDDRVALALVAQELKSLREGQQQMAETLSEAMKHIHENSRNQERLNQLEEEQTKQGRKIAQVQTSLRTWVTAGGVLVTLANLLIALLTYLGG